MDESMIFTKLFPNFKISKFEDNLYTVYVGNKFITWIDTVVYDAEIENDKLLLVRHVNEQLEIRKKENYTTLVVIDNDYLDTVLSLSLIHI
jgi:hypothetical protein